MMSLRLAEKRELILSGYYMTQLLGSHQPDRAAAR
jgi:hypothetical protein